MNKTGFYMKLGGPAGERFDANNDMWLLGTPYANPGMFEMFGVRDKPPGRKLVPWYGEFAGKYLTSAVLCYRMNRDEKLYDTILYTVDKLLASQACDGYLGVFPEGQRLVGSNDPDNPGERHWDLWNHYHCMYGLLLWHRDSGDARAMDTISKAARYITDFFTTKGNRIEDAGWGETNMGVLHAFALLYKETGEVFYLDFAEKLLEAIASPAGGNYLNDALKGVEFYKMAKPRWESLHAVQGLAAMYGVTGDERYKRAVLHIWRSIQKTDRHNTGGFSSGEQAQGDPYDPRPIETCCTVAWIALSIDTLKLTGSSVVADEIEISTLNGILGAQHPSGRYFTYNTPMIGEKIASATQIVFQSRAGSPELNCCSVNGPRGIGMIGEWGVIEQGGRINVNYYGQMDARIPLSDGNTMELRQRTDYPADGKIALAVKLDRAGDYVLRMRIPIWSDSTVLRVDGMPAENVRNGEYYDVPLTEAQCAVDIELDMSLHYWPGGGEAANLVSIYRGPTLLAYDQRFNDMDYNSPPRMDLTNMDYEVAEVEDYPKPWILCKFRDENGGDVYLCDFATAGQTGMGYNTWLPASPALPPANLDSDAPAWSYRLE